MFSASARTMASAGNVGLGVTVGDGVTLGVGVSLGVGVTVGEGTAVGVAGSQAVLARGSATMQTTATSAVIGALHKGRGARRITWPLYARCALAQGGVNSAERGLQNHRASDGWAGILRGAMRKNELLASARVVFMGTPDFAVPTLRRLLEETTVVGVFTRPDRPAGRGRSMRSSPVAEVARADGVPLFQPRGLRRGPDAAPALEALAALESDVVVVAAYGLILPAEALGVARHGALNVHASLLPRWRGAAPIHHAILAGDPQSGITIMLMDEGLDTGPVLSMEAIDIGPEETAGELFDRLAELGADLLVKTLPEWISGSVTPAPQDHEAATHAPRLSKADGALDWSRPAEELALQVRGLHPWPGAFTHMSDGSRLKVHVARADSSGTGTTPALTATPTSTLQSIQPSTSTPAQPSADRVLLGTVVNLDGSPGVCTGHGVLVLERIQAAGGRAMNAADFMRGRPELLGQVLGEKPPEAGLSADQPHTGTARSDVPSASR